MAQTNTESARKYRERLRQDPERWAHFQSKKREQNRQWRERNSDKMKSIRRVSEAKRRAAGNVDTEWADVLVNDPCAYCGEPGGVIEHITPIAKGGTSNWQNLTGSCKSCNSRKNIRPWWRMYVKDVI